MQLSGRQTQFYIDVLYGVGFAAGFGYLLFVGMDARVVAFQGGLVLGYILRVWENMSVYERILQEEVAAEAEDAVAHHIEETMPGEVEEAVADELEETMPGEVERAVAEEVEGAVAQQAEEAVPEEVSEELTDEIKERVGEEVAKCVGERVPKKVKKIAEHRPPGGTIGESSESDRTDG